MDCSDLEIISVILGIYYKEVTKLQKDEVCKSMKGTWESLAVVDFWQTDTSSWDTVLVIIFKKKHVFVSPVLHVLIRVAVHYWYLMCEWLNFIE